jgi:F-type H+-transporting ATPase subunit gamma
MEMVSASRMRRSQERVLAARPYAEKTRELMRRLARASVGEAIHPLLTVRPVRHYALILIASDRGLCGAYNHNVVHEAARYVAGRSEPATYIAVGRRAREAIMRWGGDLMAEFEGIPADLTIAYASPIARLVEDAFLGGDIDAAVVAYTRFVSAGTQRAEVRQLLPIVPPAAADGDASPPEPRHVEYIYEPSPAAILERLLPHSLEVEMLGFLLESVASEHSARMIAMRSATDNANEMVDDLTRTYNRMRQSAITSELLDITGTTEALRSA